MLVCVGVCVELVVAGDALMRCVFVVWSVVVLCCVVCVCFVLSVL